MSETEAVAKVQTKPAAIPYVHVPSADAVKRNRLSEIRHEVTEALDSWQVGIPMPAILQESLQLIKPPASNSLQLREFSNAQYRLGVNADVDLRQLHRLVNFWSALAGRGLQKFDDIRVISEDECAMADFVVVDADDKFVDAMLVSFHKVQRRARPQGETSWLHQGDTLVQRPPKGTLPGGYVIVRENGVELSQSGLPFKTIEEARRYYLDHAINRDSKIAQYFPR